ERRYGEVLREEFGIEPGALTAAEAGYVVGFRDADSLRARARSARAERADRLASKALSEGEGGVKASRGAAPAISVREHRGRNGDRSHITRVEEGMVPVSAIRHLAGERGEVRGAHRNRQGKDWDDFL